jgi:hypothetical protein
LPILAGTHNHAFVVCGYRRSPTKPNWIDFIRNDDQKGPYLLIDDVLNDSAQPTPWRTLHVPLPEKIWLSPEAAEQAGALYLRGISSAVAPKLAAESRRPIASLDVLIALKRLALRTYVVESREFKNELLNRGVPDSIAQAYRYLSMSRYVWVVEAIDRGRRLPPHYQCVVGQAVYDATSSDAAPNRLALEVHGALWTTRGKKPTLELADPYCSGAVGEP